MKQWEISYTFDWSTAEAMAEDGWELVSVSPALLVYGFGITYYYFKRPLLT